MKGERGQNIISIYLTADEVYRLQDGHTVGERLGVTHPDSKVEVLPLSATEEDDSLKDQWSDDRLTRAQTAELKGNLFFNGDIQVIVPAISLSDVRVASLHLPRERVSIQMPENEAYLTQMVPEGGVTVHLGGSLRVIDVYKELYSE